MIDLEHGRGFTTTIGNATVVNYAYATETLAHDLEEQFSRIEGRGIPTLLKLRYGHTLSRAEKAQAIAYLDMHLERGRHAHQTRFRAPALLIKTGGRSEEADLNFGDLMTLSQHTNNVVRLAPRGLEDWPWEVCDLAGLATGDGGVLLWRDTAEVELSTVTFPLSPTQLLLIGTKPRSLRSVGLNTRLAQNCRRWIVGTVRSLNKDRATIQTGRYLPPAT